MLTGTTLTVRIERRSLTPRNRKLRTFCDLVRKLRDIEAEYPKQAERRAEFIHKVKELTK